MGDDGTEKAPASPAGVAILGMHRSGTSAVAGFLTKAGFFAGTEGELLPAAEDNPRGFFEREDVNALNDSLLAALGGAWDKPLAREVVEGKAPAWRPQVTRLLAGLDAEAGDRPLMLKDPRISLLLPAWLPALERRFVVLLVDRSPMEVALSVRRRDGRPLYVALALWQLYCTELLHGLAGQRVLVVRYEHFVADPVAQGAVLLERLGEALPEGTAASVDPARAEGFVSPEMRHQRSERKAQVDMEVLTHAQLELAGWFGDLPEGWLELQPPRRLASQSAAALATAAEYYDAMGDRYGMETAYDLERHKALHFEQATELKDQHIANLEGAIAQLRRQVGEQEARVNELKSEIEGLRAAKSDLDGQLRTLREDSRAAASNLVSAARHRLASRS
ncbi:MAG TPA: hypothetical protein VK425_03215 [Acidimicrobiales bacterium]|nr:hypothetical protein [Acidimicrobiales bacterium]